ncbi:MAG: DUF362 domain-containing protein [Deltaproteobacteria bacterium]|nr:DUF362 domain-containing protein [Deltaproteobacteria bacterium]
MKSVIVEKISSEQGVYIEALSRLLDKMEFSFHRGHRIAIKIHWGERGNKTFLRPEYTVLLVKHLKSRGLNPFVFDTTVLYSGGRRRGDDSLKTAAEHGFSEDILDCPVIIGDGLDGRNIMDIKTDYRHFSVIQVARTVTEADGFVIFSHFKGHLGAGFGGAVKNISMGFASRAQKQRMHADARPELNARKCSRCGICIDICPVRAAEWGNDTFPCYDRSRCIGCAQCIANCPDMALKIHWNTDARVFQEKLIETAAAVWKIIGERSLCINGLITIGADCDCLPGDHTRIAPDIGFVGGYHPLEIDKTCLDLIGAQAFRKAHPRVPWERQFEYAEEIGFREQSS